MTNSLRVVAMDFYSDTIPSVSAGLRAVARPSPCWCAACCPERNTTGALNSLSEVANIVRIPAICTITSVFTGSPGLTGACWTSGDVASLHAGLPRLHQAAPRSRCQRSSCHSGSSRLAGFPNQVVGVPGGVVHGGRCGRLE